ncbi:glycoside hydrolase 5 family protein [Bradyrhizobium monzae]|uniref:cellulase family glycosylhydrolase n=1 Tax=Bradyrhizobium sp. Oc8 TaxID=2876780 RepID=UPI001F2B79CF|nr:cellulase family glycosylhydrolase [Bradyrhizobium sp. Oc8]
MTFPIHITRATKLILAAVSAVVLASLFVHPATAETKTIVFPHRDAPATAPRQIIFGANIHYGLRRILGYTSVDQGIKQLSDIGAVSFRDYLPWQSFDFRSGAPSLVYSERLMSFLPQARFKPLLNLGGANSQVSGGVPPMSEEGLQYFDRYLEAVVATTKKYDPIYEIWNEWNMYIGTGPRMPRLQSAGDASDPRAAIHYARIARTAVDTIKNANPHAVVIVGAVGDDADWAWAQAITRYGALDHADGLSVHLYNQCARLASDRTAKEMIVRLERLQGALRSIRNGQETPIYVTEFGWPTSQGNCGMPLDVSAYNFAHFILESATLPWLRGAWMHELKNVGPDPVERENNFGLFTFDDKPKPAVCFMRQAIDLVRSAKLLELREPFPDVFVLRAVSAGRQTVVLWTSGPFRHANYKFDDTALHARMMCGDTIPTSQRASVGAQPAIYEFDQSSQISVTLDTGELPAQGHK